jgi:membrane protein
LAFYAFFSLFPLLAVAVTVMSFFADEERILKTLIQFLVPIFPVSQGLIAENLRRFIGIRGTIGIIGTLGLLWAASSVFTIVIRNINRAWTTARAQNFLHTRLIALGVIGVMLVLLLLAQLGSSLIDLLSTVRIPILGDYRIPDSWFSVVITEIVPLVLTFFIFVMLYRYIPHTQVRWREALWGALVVSLFWEITSRIFIWYIGSGLAQYDILYGSLATLIGLMFWFYINSLIMIFGAYISSAIAQRHTDQSAAIPISSSPGTHTPQQLPSEGYHAHSVQGTEHRSPYLPGRPPNEK